MACERYEILADVGGGELFGQRMLHLKARCLAGRVGRMLVLQRIVAPTELQLAVTGEPNLARTMSATPVVSVFVAPVVVEVVFTVNDG